MKRRKIIIMLLIVPISLHRNDQQHDYYFSSLAQLTVSDIAQLTVTFRRHYMEKSNTSIASIITSIEITSITSILVILVISGGQRSSGDL